MTISFECVKLAPLHEQQKALPFHEWDVQYIMSHDCSVEKVVYSSLTKSIQYSETCLKRDPHDVDTLLNKQQLKSQNFLLTSTV